MMLMIQLSAGDMQKLSAGLLMTKLVECMQACAGAVSIGCKVIDDSVAHLLAVRQGRALSDLLLCRDGRTATQIR